MCGDRGVMAAALALRMRGYTLTAQEDFDSCLRMAHVDLLACVAVRDRVIVLIELDVIVDADTRNLPLCVLIRPFWQRPKCRAIEFLEGAAAATGQLLEWPVVQFDEQRGDCAIGFVEAE